MIPTLFDFGFFGVHSFGVMLLCSFLAAWRLLWLRLKREGENPVLAEALVFWAAIGGVIGARLTYLISFPEELRYEPLKAIFGGAGFVFYGGLLGGILAVIYLLKKHGRSIALYADLVAPTLSLAYGVGRIGCHLSGDGDYGHATSLPWALSYHWGVVPTPEGVLVHPAPIYETLLAYLVTVILLRVERGSVGCGSGRLFALYLVLASICRFAVESIRIEPVIAYGLTQAQLWSLVLCVIGSISYVMIQKRNA